MIKLEVHIAEQKLYVLDDSRRIKEYLVSTAKNGAGERLGSEQTPRGKHIIRAKIGRGCTPGTVFRGRRPTGEICTPELWAENPNRDWILTRIFWLSGLEVNKNRLGEVDTMRRYIYIHGTPDEIAMGIPGSKGCIRMRNAEIIELFDYIPAGTHVLIQE